MRRKRTFTISPCPLSSIENSKIQLVLQAPSPNTVCRLDFADACNAGRRNKLYLERSASAWLHRADGANRRTWALEAEEQNLIPRGW